MIPGELVKLGLDNRVESFLRTKNVTELEMILITWGWQKEPEAERLRAFEFHPEVILRLTGGFGPVFFNLLLGETVTKSTMAFCPLMLTPRQTVRAVTVQVFL